MLAGNTDLGGPGWGALTRIIPFNSVAVTLTLLVAGATDVTTTDLGLAALAPLGFSFELDEEDDDEEEEEDVEDVELEDEEEEDEDEEPCLSRALSLRWPLEPLLLFPDDALEGNVADDAFGAIPTDVFDAGTACLPGGTAGAKGPPFALTSDCC